MYTYTDVAFIAVVLFCGDLHFLSLDDVEDIALIGYSNVQPDTCHQMAQGAASWNVRAPPNVQPLPQHLGHTVKKKLKFNIKLKYHIVLVKFCFTGLYNMSSAPIQFHNHSKHIFLKIKSKFCSNNR